MNDYIAYCGLDCETCEAHIATVNNDYDLRIKVAKEWSELNSVEITPEMINCAGSMFNIYHVSPHETQDPDEYVTEVCYAVK